MMPLIISIGIIWIYYITCTVIYIAPHRGHNFNSIYIVLWSLILPCAHILLSKRIKHPSLRFLLFVAILVVGYPLLLTLDQYVSKTDVMFYVSYATYILFYLTCVIHDRMFLFTNVGMSRQKKLLQYKQSLVDSPAVAPTDLTFLYAFDQIATVNHLLNNTSFDGLIVNNEAIDIRDIERLITKKCR